MPIVHCNGADLYYEACGEGEPLVFLHGAWVGLRYFEPQLQDLSAEFRTVAMDFRGHGRSEKTDGGHTIAQHARDLHAVLEALAIDDAVLVGWSMGAIVSWEYVDQYGTDRVRALVDVDMEACPMIRDDNEFGSYSVDGLGEVLGRIQSDPIELLEEQIGLLLADEPSRDLWITMVDEGSRTPAAIKGAMLLELLCDYREVLPTIDVPTLVCVGLDGSWREPESVEHVATLIPNARVARFPESSHCLTLEEPDRFNRELREFVRSL